MMRFFALSMLLLITMGSAQNDTQTSPASEDYQSGFARGLELGMVVASLQGAASFSPEASELFNQTALKFNQVLDQVFGQGSNLSNLYRLQLYGLKSNNATNITEEQTAVNITAENTTAENMTAENMTAENTNIKNTTTSTAIENTIAENITAVKTTEENITAENHTAKDLIRKRGHSLKNETTYSINATDNTKELAIPKFIDNIAIGSGGDITDDLSDIIKNKDWDGNLETVPESMSGMPGPETV